MGFRHTSGYADSQGLGGTVVRLRLQSVYRAGACTVADPQENACAVCRSDAAPPTKDSTPATPGGRWLYPLLLAMQTVGVIIFYWQGIPLYRQASASPSAYESQLGARIWALLAIAITQVGYWVRYQMRPALPHLANAVLGHVVLFWSRLSFTLPTSVFSLVFVAKKLNLQMSTFGYILTIADLFSLFCYMQETQRLGNTILDHHKNRRVTT